VVVDAELEAIAPLQRFHIALACHSVAVKPRFHRLASVAGKGVEVFGGPQREDDRFHRREYR